MSDKRSEFKKSDNFEKEQSSRSKLFNYEFNAYPCWWNSASAIQSNSKPVSGVRVSGNQIKYFGNTSTEFQSLKLESICSTMEELKLVSANFSALLEQEVFSKRYKDITPSCSKDHTDSKSVQSSWEDESVPEHFLSQQTTFFDQMREFLLAQQMCLKQNLEMLHSKTTSQRREIIHYTSDGKPQDVNPDDVNQNEEFDGLRQWECSSAGKTNKIQICPVCGMEFEVTENPDALEEHVASHWSSSEPL